MRQPVDVERIMAAAPWAVDFLDEREARRVLKRVTAMRAIREAVPLDDRNADGSVLIPLRTRRRLLRLVLKIVLPMWRAHRRCPPVPRLRPSLPASLLIDSNLRPSEPLRFEAEGSRLTSCSPGDCNTDQEVRDERQACGRRKD